jgi:hypothetical protein
MQMSSERESLEITFANPLVYFEIDKQDSSLNVSQIACLACPFGKYAEIAEAIAFQELAKANSNESTKWLPHHLDAIAFETLFVPNPKSPSIKTPRHATRLTADISATRFWKEGYDKSLQDVFGADAVVFAPVQSASTRIIHRFQLKLGSSEIKHDEACKIVYKLKLETWHDAYKAAGISFEKDQCVLWLITTRSMKEEVFDYFLEENIWVLSNRPNEKIKLRPLYEIWPPWSKQVGRPFGRQ